MRVDTKDGANSVCVGKFDIGQAATQALFLSPQFAAPLDKDGTPAKAAWVCPFFMVRDAGANAKVNLAFKVLRHEVAGREVRVPLLVNIKALDAGDELLYDKNSPNALQTMKTYVTERGLINRTKRRRIDAP